MPALAMCPDSKLNFFVNGMATHEADKIWVALDERCKKAILWDCPYNERKERFRKALARAANVGIWRIGGKAAYLAWTISVGRECRTGFVHFTSFQGEAPKNATEYWRQYILLSEAYELKCLLALVPGPYRATRLLALQCGFSLLTVLPGACHMAIHNRIVDGYLYRLELHE